MSHIQLLTLLVLVRPSFSFSFFVFLKTMLCFKHPPTDKFILPPIGPSDLRLYNSSLSCHQAPFLYLIRPGNFFFERRRGGMGLLCPVGSNVSPNAAETIFKTIRQPPIRQSDIRQPDNRPYTNKQRKSINPKQGKEQTAVARANGMSRCRSTIPRSLKISYRGNGPRTSIDW